MTRDTQGLHGDRDSAGEAEVYTALWSAATFPRLPTDAPNELKKLTVDVDDPKRVYVIHRASRRHHLQNLVEKYTFQIRYGCKSNSCTTPTCFSCRKRLAASVGAPVRRYNATSARTLAVYLSSQDNPEQGLCHNASAEIPVNSIKNGATKLAKRGSTSIDDKDLAGRNRLQSEGTRNSGSPNSESQLKAASRRASSSDIQAKVDKEEAVKTKRSSIVDVLDERTTLDHRSFVQNVFGTVAFKMLEWLTPRHLDLLARSTEKYGMELEERAKSTHSSLSHLSYQNTILEAPPKAEKTKDRSELLLDTQSDVHNNKPTNGSIPTPQKVTTSKSVTAGDGEPKATGFVEPRSGSNPAITQVPMSNHRKWPDPIESQLPKGILNVSASPKPSETVPDIRPLSRDRSNSKPKRRMSRTSLVTSPTMRVGQLAPVHSIQTQPIRETTSSKPKVSESHDKEKLTSKDSHNALDLDKSLQSPSKQISDPIQRRLLKNVALPQSLSRLTIEVIEFICDILQLDNTCENHFLQPYNIGQDLKRHRNNKALLKRTPCREGSAPYPTTLKHQWNSFAEQAFFDTLCKPESLLRSFRDDEKILFDTQTLWYLMLRMTRVAPSLVFDSLWNVTGTLFQPPERLEGAYDWAKETTSPGAVSNKSVSNNDVAQIMSVCLHALIAAAPLVSDSRQLANMSRIRSYGLTTLGREHSSALEPVALCLQYDDAFTNDLALRLARRLFAAIPTRRRYAELLELQRDVRSNERREPDVLDTVLDTLKFIDLGMSPIFNFPDDERDLHEKRVPTLILDWARTVMLQDWETSAEVPSDGPFGGALAMITAIYKNRKSLLLGDIHFRTEYFAERLDPIEMPIEWLNFSPNKRTVHLLDYPYLFNPSTLVTYFRAINYSRMNQAYEIARDKEALIRHMVGENRSGESRLMADEDCQQKLHNRLRTATAKFMMLDIRRTHVLQDAFNSIWRREERELMRPLKVRLGEEDGEQGMDIGGVQQEFFRLAIAEALNPAYGAFTIDSRTKMTWFQPGSPEPLWKFQLIGMIVSLAVYNGLNLPVTFPKALYMKLLGEDVLELHHIADGWPDLANGLTTLLEWDEKNGLIEDVFTRTYEFSVELFGQPISLEMGTEIRSWPQFADSNVSSHTDAPLVTNANRNGYVSDYIRWLTDVSIQPQFEAFKRGFFTCINRRSISLFDPNTLQSVVEGVQEIDISEMRRAARYVGWEASNRTVKDFWSIVRKYDLEQKKKLLEFVTASDRVPVGGMRNLQFTLQKNGVGDDHLPSSYTCFGILLLPEYSSKEVLRQNLTTALENSMGFGFA